MRTINFVYKNLIPLYLKLQYAFMQRQFYRLFNEHRPDLIISVIPVINYPASCAAQQIKVPFVIMTLDTDIRLWLLVWKNRLIQRLL